MGGAAGLLQACGGGGDGSAAEAPLMAGDVQCENPLAANVKAAAVPANQVNLADYGGVPGASAANIKNAFNQAFAKLKSLGGGTLNVGAGTYNLGNQPSEVDVIAVSDLKNVVISGYGAQLTMNTTARGMPVFLSFYNPNNVTVAGMRFYDAGTNLNVEWQGAVCISVDTSVACSGFTTVDCVAENVGTFFRSMPSANYTGTGFDIQGTVKTAYYGVNCNYNGRFSKCNLTCHNVRRAFIAYGTRDWDITVTGSADGTALGSNAYVCLTLENQWQVENCTVNLTMSGNARQYLGLVHFYHQGPKSTPYYMRNVTANVTMNNVAGSTSMFLFDHEPPPYGVIASSTTSTWEQITLTGTVVGSYAGRIVSNPTVSTGSTNSISVASNLAAMENMSALPKYFKVFTPPQCKA
jgi:hypothetical protein